MSFPVKIKSSPLWLVVATVSFLAVIATVFVATGLDASARKRNAILARTNDATRRANAELDNFNDDVLTNTRAQADLFRATLLNDANLNAFKEEQQPFWQISQMSSEKTPEYKKVRFELSKIGASMSDWPRIIESIQSLQSSHGMTVRQIEILTAGDANQRTFDRVTLGITLFVRLADK